MKRLEIPKRGRYVTIYGKLGRKVLANYIEAHQSGGSMKNVSLTDWVRMFDSKLKVKSLDDIKKWTAEDVGRYSIEVAALANDSKTMIAVAEEMGAICKETDVDGAMLYEVITESDDEEEALKTIKGWHKKIKSTVASHIFIPLDNLRKSEESKGSE